MKIGKDIIKKEVISMRSGRRLGTVDDIYLGASLERIAGLFLGSSGGLFSRKASMIPFKQVKLLGEDVVLVLDDEVVQGEDELAQTDLWTRLDKLRGRLVDTTGGTRIGKVEDVLVDVEGKVLGFRVGSLEVKGPIAQRKVIGYDTIIDLGQIDGTMTIDLEKAENEEISLA